MIEAHTREWWRATLALCLGSFTVFINLYAPQPLLPSLRQTFGVSTLAVSLIMSVATLSLAASLLVFGTLSDAVGRRIIMRVTLVITTLLTLVISVAPNFESLLLLRVLQGFVLGGLPAVAIAWMGDEFDKRALMMAVALYISANTLGGIGGRIMGGFAAEQGNWQTSFLVVGLVSVVCVAVFWRLLPAARHFQPAPFRLGPALAAIRGHLRNPLLLGAYGLGGLAFMIFINQYSYITFRLSDAPYGLGTQWLGMIFLTYLGGTFGSVVSGRVAQRLPQPVCMMIGVAIFMLGTLVTLSPALWLILLGLTINAFGFFFAHSMASSWVGRHANAARGSASALYLVFYYSGASLGGLYLEPFWQLGAWQGVALGSWIVLAVTFCLAFWLQRRERAAHAGSTVVQE
ncbi:MFS transporter [Litchfieldella xinjiangensis]|uniref:MFS transporter n=1 Tax=Litchfieldella xinjiangensis TaxID=1166948 RepID=UPI0005B7F236|nr:MFS transporter [Halomonas xinjiangensis]